MLRLIYQLSMIQVKNICALRRSEEEKKIALKNAETSTESFFYAKS